MLLACNLLLCFSSCCWQHTRRFVCSATLLDLSTLLFTQSKSLGACTAMKPYKEPTLLAACSWHFACLSGFCDSRFDPNQQETQNKGFCMLKASILWRPFLAAGKAKPFAWQLMRHAHVLDSHQPWKCCWRASPCWLIRKHRLLNTTSNKATICPCHKECQYLRMST